MSVGLLKSVYYPESDGKPMGETDWHIAAILRLRELLSMHYEGQQVYVGTDMLLYYEQDNPKKFVVPDVFVVKGIEPKMRRIYRLWRERKAPDVIIEVTSTKTRKKDAFTKPDLYASFGVSEYFVYDPDQGYLDPTLQGHRMVGGCYEPISPESDGSLISQQLEMRLWDDGKNLQLTRLDNNQRLLTGRELAVEACQTAENAKQLAALAEHEAEASKVIAATETAKRIQAEAEIARLKAELAGNANRPASEHRNE